MPVVGQEFLPNLLPLTLLRACRVIPHARLLLLISWCVQHCKHDILDSSQPIGCSSCFVRCRRSDAVSRIVNASHNVGSSRF